MRISDWSSDVCSSALVELVVSPAVGGIIPGYETARALGCHAVFVEREEGEFRLRRGFEIPAGARVVMVEDIVTTGLSSRECLTAIRAHPGELLGAACIIDRSNGRADVGARSEEHTSELPSLLRNSYAVFCLKKNNIRRCL